MIKNRDRAKKWQSTFHVIINANSTVQHVIQIKNRIIKYVNKNVKGIISGKAIIVGTVVHVFVRTVSIKKNC